MISTADTPQVREGKLGRSFTDSGTPPSRRAGYNAPYTANASHWNRVFTDQDYFDSIAKQKGVAEAAKVSPFGDDYVYRQAMIGYMADKNKVPLEDMRAIYDTQKDSFAKKMLGKQTITSRELFDWHKKQFEQDNEKETAARQVLNNIIKRSVEDSLTGNDTPFVESVAKDIDAAGDMFSEEDKARLWEQAEAMDIKVRQAHGAVAEDARFIFETLRQQSSGDQGVNPVDINEMASRFAQLPDNQRKAVYEMVGAYSQVAQIDKGFWHQMAESLGRGAAGFTERIPRNIKEQNLRGNLRLLQSEQPVFKAQNLDGSVTYSAAGDAPITPQEREQAIAQTQSELGVLKVERELRDLAERVVDPIKTVTFLPTIVEEGLYGAAQSIPYTAAAAVPYAGVPAVASALFSANYDQIMLEYDGIDPDKAALVAAISAPIEAGLERMKVNTIMGRLPIVGGLVKRLKHPNQRNLTRILIGGTGVVVEQNAQEILQNATFPLVQTIGAALDQDIPQYKLDVASIPRDLAVQFVALLPLSLMGIGALSYREIQRGENYLTNKDNLEKVGFSQEQIDAITGSATPEEAQDRLREEYTKRDPKLVKAAAKRVLDEVVALREQQAPASLPRIERQGGEYVVLKPDGTVITRSTDQGVAEQALVSARRDSVRREMQNVTAGINEAAEFIQKVNAARQRGEDISQLILEFSGRTLFTDYEANPTQDNLNVLFETARSFGFDPKEPEDLKMFPVLGSNQGALREGIWRSIIRINEGADGTIVMREFAQDNLKRAVAENRVTLDWVRQRLNEILPQIESDRIKRRLRTETDTDVIEAFSDVALAYFRGQIRDEQIPDGLRGFFRRMAIIMRDIFRRAYNLARLRAEGKLDRDFEALLAEAVGVDQQALVDRARERTEQEVGAPAMSNYSIAVTPQQDTDYLAAVERGDMETAQRMVDEAARRAGYDVGTVYHGTNHNFNKFSKEVFANFNNAQKKLGFFFTPEKDYAQQYGGRVINAYLRGNFKEESRSLIDEIETDWTNQKAGSYVARLKREGFDGVIFDGATKEIAVFNPNQIKSADPVTYDAKGNVIPLSQRFDATTANINYSIVRSVDHFKNDTRFDKLVKDGRVFTGVDVNDFIDQHILLHSPDNAFAGTIQLTDGGEIKGKGGVYYPALYADDNYFWASTEAMVMRTANHLNEIGAKNGGRILMGLVSAPVEKLFSSTSMSTGVVKFLNALTNDPRAGLRKSDLNAMLVAASKVEVVKKEKDKPDVIKTFKTKLKASDSYATNFGKIDALLEPNNSVFQVRKAFVESLADQIAKHLNATPATAEYVAGILADAENKHAKNAIKRGKLSKASFLQGLGNMLTEPFLRDFQEHGNGKIYAIVEVEGRVKGIATTEHESYPATIVPENQNSKVKLHVLKEAVDWQDVVGKETGQYATPQERLNLLPTSGMSSTNLKVLGVKAGSSAAPLNYSIATSGEMRDDRGMLASLDDAEYLKRVAEGDLEGAKRTLGSVLGNSGIPIVYLADINNPSGGWKMFPATFVRFGLPPTDTPSGIYRGAERIGQEAGVSVYAAWKDPKTGKYVIRSGGVSEADSGGRKAYEVVGQQLADVGADEEALLKTGDVRVVREIPLSDITDDNDPRIGYDGSDFEESDTTPNWADAPDLLDPVVLYDAQGNIVPPSVRFPSQNYSISTKSEIDRVQAAMDRLSRSPSERIAQYAALKERLAAALERNKPIMQSMRGDMLPQDFDRTRLLNDLGFLDYILKVLPPEVRGRVGGYTNLASIAPVDVYKGDEKVSEAKNPAGAIISAWMREGLNIGQAQKKTELPEGYSTVANTTDERRDKTIANFLIDRLKKIDRELERYYKRDLMDQIFNVLDKSRPKAGESGVKRSTLGAETQKFADMVYRASLLDDEQTAERLAAIEAAITSTESSQDSQKRISELSEEWTIVNTFGDLKNRPSETMAYGLEWLQGQLKAGREAWNIKETARIEENRQRVADALVILGKPTDKGRFENPTALKRFLQNINALDLDHKSFEQFATIIFGDKLGGYFSEKLRQADISAAKAELENTKKILNALREGAKAAGMSTGKALVKYKREEANVVRKLEGRKVKNTEIAIDLAKKIVRGLADRGSLSKADVETLADELASLPRDTKKQYVTIKQVVYRGDETRISMNRATAMQLWLSWQQSDIQEKMRREGWNDDSAEDLENLLSDPVSQAILKVTRSIYGGGYALTNPVYSRMFGMNMPMVKNYAPARFLNAKEVKDVSLDGTPLTAGGQPSFAKSRVTHSAKIANKDGLVVLQQHIAQQAHWVAFAELTREYRSLLSNPEVRDAITQRYGDGVLATADSWAEQMEQRGGNKGREIAWINNMLGAAIGGQSVSLLGFNLKSLMMQTDNLMRSPLALDSRQIASAMSDPAGLMRAIRKVWKTDLLQTRLEGGATAETRFLFSRFVSMFRRGAKISELAMMPMNYVDSAGLSISGAIVYQAAYKDAIDSGMTEQMADQAAKDAVEAMIYRYGQPVLMGQKSNIENSGNVFAKTFFLFMSDPRLKTALLADSIRGLATGQGNWKDHVRRIVAVEMMAIVSHVLATAFRDATSDDDDEDLWSMGGFARALLLAPLQGYFLVGSVSEVVLSRLTEARWFTPTQNPLIRTADTALKAFNNLDDAFNFDDPDALVKEWTNITRSIAVTPPLAAPAVALNLVRPLVQAWERMDDE